MTRNYLSLCAIIRDQEHYVKEWLTFHRLIGVERFYLLLNECEDRTFEKIRELPFRDDIRIYFDHPRRAEGNQPSWYLFVAQEFGKETRWMLQIDADEYFFGTKEDWLPTILERYEKHGGLVAPWVMFGHNNQLKPSDGLSIETLNKRIYYSNVVKTCYQPKHFLNDYHLIHTPKTSVPLVTGDYRTVDLEPERSKVDGVTNDVVRINHYHYRSLADYVRRIYYVLEKTVDAERGLGLKWAGIYDPWLDRCREEWVRSKGGEVDTTIQRFVPLLKKELGL